MSQKTGGPAFPIGSTEELHRIGIGAIEGVADVDERDRLYIAATAQAAQGMTMRDYFAAKAMQGFNANPDEQFTRMNLTAVAQMAYQQADEMLAAREVQP